MDQGTLKMNPDELKALKKKYNEAVRLQQHSFKFQGKDLLTSYAKYLIEHLETVFAKEKQQELNMYAKGEACIIVNESKSHNLKVGDVVVIQDVGDKLYRVVNQDGRDYFVLHEDVDSIQKID